MKKQEFLKERQPEATDPSKTTNRKLYRRVIAGIISGGIAVIVLVWMVRQHLHENEIILTDQAQVESTVLTANSKVAGYIRAIKVKNHQRVHKGDTLVIIDNLEYKLLVSQAEASLYYAKATKNLMSTDKSIARNAVNISDANAEEVYARLKNTETNYTRELNLMNDDVVTRYQFDQAKADFDAIKAKYNALIAQKHASELNQEESGKKISMCDADILKAEAALAYAKLNLSYTIITAPCDGVVTGIYLQEQQLTQPGPLIKILKDDKKWITANLKESELKDATIGRNVKITIANLNNLVLQGKISSIAESGTDINDQKYHEPHTSEIDERYPATIDFTAANPEYLKLLRCGMTAQISIENN